MLNSTLKEKSRSAALLAEAVTAENENERRGAEEVLLSTVDATGDDKLTHFALRLAFAGHVSIPREGTNN